MENWKDVIGFEGYYQVSNLGKIKSLSRYIKHSRGSDMLLKEKILSTQVNCHGYLKVILSKHNSQKTFRVHTLVCKAFLNNPENKRDINHINGNKTDNRLINLEYNTRSENMKHCFRIGLNCHKGQNHNQSKLNEKDVLDIRSEKYKGFKIKDIAFIYGVKPCTISNIIAKRIWIHI
jgi:hypothetical protein